MSDGGTVTLDLPRQFGAADCAVVRVGGAAVREVSDPARVAAFVAALAPLGEGWGVPDAGVPVTRIRVDLAAGDTAVGNLGVGKRVLVAHVHGGFVSRSSTEDVARALLGTLSAGAFLDESPLDGVTPGPLP